MHEITTFLDQWWVVGLWAAATAICVVVLIRDLRDRNPEIALRSVDVARRKRAPVRSPASCNRKIRGAARGEVCTIANGSLS